MGDKGRCRKNREHPANLKVRKIHREKAPLAHKVRKEKTSSKKKNRKSKFEGDGPRDAKWEAKQAAKMASTLRPDNRKRLNDVIRHYDVEAQRAQPRQYSRMVKFGSAQPPL